MKQLDTASAIACAAQLPMQRLPELAPGRSKSGVRAVSRAGRPDLLEAYLAYLDQLFRPRTLV
jgi:hypothetical protein